jgi:hypothetical protein
MGGWATIGRECLHKFNPEPLERFDARLQLR